MSLAEELLAAGDAALRRAGSSAAEVVVTAEHGELTRFAGNVIHQSVAEQSRRIRARVIWDDRVGVAEVRGFRDDAPERVMAAAEQARRLLTVSEVSPLPKPDGGDDHPVAFAASTRAATPEDRAGLVAIITESARARGLGAYGALSTGTTTTAVVNTAGVRRFAETAQASVVTVVRGDDGAGYASRHAADITDLDVDGMCAEVLETCERNQHAVGTAPGEYEVVLSPYAVTDMLEHLAWVGFGALAAQEHRSFMRIGERLMNEQVTIRDDCRDPEGFPFPFDAEGVSTRPVTLIDSGVCAGLVYDTPTALLDGLTSTGHSIPQPNTFGPYARHLVMAAGDRPWRELVASVKRGLYVTRFWYVRDVHPLRTTITGMTREGTFLIEDGRLASPVKDLRFTQSIVDALDVVEGCSVERRLELGEDLTAVLAPWLHIKRFTFTS